MQDQVVNAQAAKKTPHRKPSRKPNGKVKKQRPLSRVPGPLKGMLGILIVYFGLVHWWIGPVSVSVQAPIDRTQIAYGDKVGAGSIEFFLPLGSEFLEGKKADPVTGQEYETGKNLYYFEFQSQIPFDKRWGEIRIYGMDSLDGAKDAAGPKGSTLTTGFETHGKNRFKTLFLLDLQGLNLYAYQLIVGGNPVPGALVFMYQSATTEADLFPITDKILKTVRVRSRSKTKGGER
jgi:hypothetical protein